MLIATYCGLLKQPDKQESASHLAAPGGHAARKDARPPLRSEGTETSSLGRDLGLCPRTVPPPGSAVASGLHPGLATLQPRWRERLPEEAVSEGLTMPLSLAIQARVDHARLRPHGGTRPFLKATYFGGRHTRSLLFSTSQVWVWGVQCLEAVRGRK